MFKHFVFVYSLRGSMHITNTSVKSQAKPSPFFLRKKLFLLRGTHILDHETRVLISNSCTEELYKFISNTYHLFIYVKAMQTTCASHAGVILFKVGVISMATLAYFGQLHCVFNTASLCYMKY